MTMRIGTGFDVHALVPGRRLVLGGVDVPHDRGLDGHSDADVLIHAIGDAILGALALGDLGRHFPDTDPRWKGADSRALLRRIAGMMEERGYAIGNVDPSSETFWTAPYCTTETMTRIPTNAAIC